MGATESTLIQSSSNDVVDNTSASTIRRSTNSNDNKYDNDGVIQNASNNKKSSKLQHQHRDHYNNITSTANKMNTNNNKKNNSNKNNNRKIPIIKGLVCGDSNVGKSCLLKRFRGEDIDIEFHNNHNNNNNNHNHETSTKRNLMALIPWSPSNVIISSKKDNLNTIITSKHPILQNNDNNNDDDKIQLHIIEYHQHNQQLQKRYHRQNIHFVIVIIDRTNRSSLIYAREFLHSFLYKNQKNNSNKICNNNNCSSSSSSKKRNDVDSDIESFPCICILLNHYDIYVNTNKYKNHDNNIESKKEKSMDLIAMEEIEKFIDEIKSNHRQYIIEKQKKCTEPLVSTSLQIQCFDSCMKNGYGVQGLNSFIVLPYLKHREMELIKELHRIRLGMDTFDKDFRSLFIDRDDDHDVDYHKEKSSHVSLTYEELEKQRITRLQEQEHDQTLNEIRKNNITTDDSEVAGEKMNHIQQRRKIINGSSSSIPLNTAQSQNQINERIDVVDEGKEKAVKLKVKRKSSSSGRDRKSSRKKEGRTTKNHQVEKKKQHDQQTKLDIVQKISDPKKALEAFLESDSDSDRDNSTQADKYKTTVTFGMSRNINVLDSDSESDSSSDESDQAVIGEKKEMINKTEKRPLISPKQQGLSEVKGVSSENPIIVDKEADAASSSSHGNEQLSDHLDDKIGKDDGRLLAKNDGINNERSPDEEDKSDEDVVADGLIENDSCEENPADKNKEIDAIHDNVDELQEEEVHNEVSVIEEYGSEESIDIASQSPNVVAKSEDKKDIVELNKATIKESAGVAGNKTCEESKMDEVPEEKKHLTKSATMENEHGPKTVYTSDSDDDSFMITTAETEVSNKRNTNQNVILDEEQPESSAMNQSNGSAPQTLRPDILAALAGAQKEAERRLADLDGTDEQVKKKKSKKKLDKKDKVKDMKNKKKKKQKKHTSKPNDDVDAEC